MIRLARFEDIQAAMTLSKAFYGEMDFDSFGYRFDHDHIASNYALAISCPEKFIFFVSEDDGVLNGLLFCCVNDTTMYFKGHRFAQEIVWHSDPKLTTFKRGKIMLSLLKAAETEMDNRGGMPFYLSSDLRPEFGGVGQYLSKKGYKKITEYWFKGV